MNRLTYERLKQTLIYTGKGSCFETVAPRGPLPAGAETGRRERSGAWSINIQDNSFQASNLVWLWHTGNLPERRLCYLDGDVGNPRIENLRELPDRDNLGHSDMEMLLRLDDADHTLSWNVSYGKIKKGDPAEALSIAGYKKVIYLGRQLLSHRIVWMLHNKEWPFDQIDHIDGNRLNNNIKNLRVVSALDNAKNKRIDVRNKSGVMGVYWYKKESKWRAQIVVNGKTKCLGYYKDIEDAARARKSAEAAFGFGVSHGRGMGAVVAEFSCSGSRKFICSNDSYQVRPSDERHCPLPPRRSTLSSS